MEYLSKWVTTLYLVTTNASHPAFEAGRENVVVIPYDGVIDFADLFEKLRREHRIDRMTVQSGGTLNAALLRADLIDHLSLVVAPLLVGGKATASLVDGESLHSPDDLALLRAAKLVSCTPLEDSYLHLRYDVVRGSGK